MCQIKESGPHHTFHWCRNACSDIDHDGEVDQPPRKLQKTGAGTRQECTAGSEAFRDCREPTHTCTPSVHEQQMPSAAYKPTDSAARLGDVQGPAHKQEGLAAGQAGLVQPESVERADSKVHKPGMCEHQQQGEDSVQKADAAAAGEHPHRSNGVCDGARGDQSREMPSCGLRGLPLRAVVAACSRGHAGETTSEEERDAKVAGSRGSSQTRY